MTTTATHPARTRSPATPDIGRLLASKATHAAVVESLRGAKTMRALKALPTDVGRLIAAKATHAAVVEYLRGDFPYSIHFFKGDNDLYGREVYICVVRDQNPDSRKGSFVSFSFSDLMFWATTNERTTPGYVHTLVRAYIRGMARRTDGLELLERWLASLSHTHFSLAKRFDLKKRPSYELEREVRHWLPSVVAYLQATERVRTRPSSQPKQPSAPSRTSRIPFVVHEGETRVLAHARTARAQAQAQRLWAQIPQLPHGLQDIRATTAGQPAGRQGTAGRWM